MKEYRLDNLTIKEHLLELAERGNKSFAESLNPGVEHVLGIRILICVNLQYGFRIRTGRSICLLPILSIWKNVCCRGWY